MYDVRDNITYVISICMIFNVKCEMTVTKDF